jgi:hypothetical protein
MEKGPGHDEIEGHRMEKQGRKQRPGEKPGSSRRGVMDLLWLKKHAAPA